MQKRLTGILATLAIILAACGGATTSPSSSTAAASIAPGGSPGAPTGESAAPSIADMADTQVLKIDLGNEPATLDPNKAQSADAIAVLQALTRPLVYFDKDLKIVDELAASHEVSADAKTLTFKLRDAKYSNGDPIVAGDLVYSWKRLLDPRTAAPYSYVMAEVVGAQDLLDLAGAKTPPTDAAVQALLDKVGVSAPDDKTFVVQLSKPATYFLSICALWITVPVEKKWIEAKGATEAANYVASGPYMLDTWNHNSQIILKPNPNWYGDQKPILTEIDMSMTTDPSQAQAAYEAGSLDMVRTPTADIQRVKADPTLGPQVVQTPQLAIDYYVFNNGTDPKTLKPFAKCSDPKACPMANKDMRIALTQAIDKKALIDATFAGVGQPANSFVMPGLPGYQADLDPYPFDLASAKTHMDTALAALGVKDAASLGKLKFGFNTGSDHESRVAFLAEAWRQAFGLQTEQIGSEFSVFLTQRTAGQFDIARDGWGADYPHANNQLGLFVCGGGNNDNQYCNKDFDTLIAQAAGEVDQDKQVALYNQAQTILMNDAAMLPLRYNPFTEEIQPYVGGLTITASDSQLAGDKFYETIYIKKH